MAKMAPWGPSLFPEVLGTSICADRLLSFGDLVGSQKNKTCVVCTPVPMPLCSMKKSVVKDVKEPIKLTMQYWWLVMENKKMKEPRKMNPTGWLRIAGEQTGAIRYC